MAEVNYLNFDVVIQRSGEGYRAQVQSPVGEATSHFTNPFTQIEVEHFMLSAAPGKRTTRRIDAPEVAAAKKFGERLYNSVFTGDVGAMLRSSLDEAWHRDSKLRVRLRLTDAPELAGIPWEYLYNPSLNRFFALDDDTAIVRYLDVPERVRPVTVALPLRVLVMISAPNDYDPLDVQQEWANLNEALADLKRNGIVHLELLEEATLSALRKQLQKEQYHIFHFIGHGGFDRQTEEGVLVLRDEAGRGRYVSGQQLGWLLHNHHTLSLAILNACEGARADRADAFAGTGQSLVQQGIPAVIAMQFEITDDAAKTFAYGFYSTLALGQPVEAALTETRLTLFSEDHGLEWGTPVLYMRSTDGRIFNVQQQEDAARKQARVSELYQAATAAMSAQDWNAATAHWRAILAIDPGHVHAAAGLEQVGKQQQLATLYTEGRAHLEAGRWHEALGALSMAQSIDADYKDVSALVGDARQRIQATLGNAQAPATNTPAHGVPAVDTRGLNAYAGPPQSQQDPRALQQTGMQGVAPQVPDPRLTANQWPYTGSIAQGQGQGQGQGQQTQLGGGGVGGGGRGAYEGAVPAPAPMPAPAPKRGMMWLIPVLLVVLLAVFGVAAFAIISSQQASERAARATATAEQQAANSMATRTTVARGRATVRANATGTAEAAEAINYANATSTAYAILIQADARNTATAQALATQTVIGTNTAGRSAKIEKIDVEHNVFNEDNIKGMKIYVTFTAENLKGLELPVNVYFTWPNGTAITSLDGTYETPDNHVAVRRDAIPQYDSTEFTNFTIFMPYHELEMDFMTGTYDLQFHVVIYDDDLVELARSEYVAFSYTSPGPSN